MKLKNTHKEFQILNKYNWDGIKYSSNIDDWKIFAKNNPKIDLNVLYTKEM